MNDRLARLWPSALLLFSLGLNCVLIGLMAGRFWEHRTAEMAPLAAEAPAQHPQSPKPEPMPLSGFGARVAQLTPDDRRSFLAGMQPYQRGIREARRALAAARRTAAETIEREPYDSAAVSAALADARAKAETVQERVQDAAIRTLAGVSADGRKTLVK